MEEEHIKPRGLCGLGNIGNTCYMNSALQALSNCPQLTQYFLKCQEFLKLPNEEKCSVAKCYRELILQIWDKKRPKQLIPSALLRAIRIHNATFRGYYQQDTQEFLRCLMDRLHEELKSQVTENCYENDDSSNVDDYLVNNGSGLLGGNASSDDSPVDMDSDCASTNVPLKRQRKRTNSKITKSSCSEKSSVIKYCSIITHIFDGKLISSVQCLTCNRVSNTIETFQDLSLPIPSTDELKRMHTQSVLSCTPNFYEDTSWMLYFWSTFKSWVVGPAIKLEDCLSAFFTNDELKGDNMYNCEKCKKLRNGVKYSRVHHLPEVLCIHLKRFRHELYHSSKINTYISFPLQDLDLNPFLSKERKYSDPSKYTLCAVICHFGSVGGGHYIAYAKNCIDNKWYEFNDSLVGEVDESVVTNSEAYVLFYSLTDLEADEFRKFLNVKLTSNEEFEVVYYVSKEWFTRYSSFVQPGPVANHDILCEHGAICIELTDMIRNMMVAIPSSVYHILVKRFGGGPEILSLDVCTQCREELERKEKELRLFKEFHRRFEEGGNAGIAFEISMQWYDAWYAYVSNDTNESPGPIDNTGITSEVPKKEQDKQSRTYGCISEETWNFLHSRYGGGPEVLFQEEQPAVESMETN